MAKCNRKSIEAQQSWAMETTRWNRQVAERVSIELPPEPPALSPFPERSDKQ